jgi:hypothetical protein
MAPVRKIKPVLRHLWNVTGRTAFEKMRKG